MATIAPRKPAAKKAAPKSAAKPAVKSVSKKPVAKKPTTKKMVVAAKKTVAKKSAPAAKKSSAKQSPAALLCEKISATLDLNKAEQITILPLIGQCSFADYMIVASGRAPRHVSALADYVTELLKKIGTPPLSVEGKDTGDWVLIDAGDIVVHIFRPEIRQFYNLEKMWALPNVSAR